MRATIDPGSRRRNEADCRDAKFNPSANEGRLKRQRTAALQDAVAKGRTPLLPRGLGVRLSSAAFLVFGP
jgi:hypothetical protein